MMESLLPHLPESIAGLLNKAGTTRNTVGHSNALVFRLESYQNGAAAYLKITPKISIETLADEARKLTWLQGKLPVPHLYVYEQNDHYEWLIMSEVMGVPSFDVSLRKNTPSLMAELAAGLRAIHAIPIVNCPFDERLEKKIYVVQENIRMRRVDVADFDDENTGKPIEELVAEILALKDTVTEELVFTHGDFSMPNILLHRHKISGFIDWSRAGVGDVYQDIAILCRSLIYNGFDERAVQLFLKNYGLKHPEEKKIALFRLIDEFY